MTVKNMHTPLLSVTNLTVAFGAGTEVVKNISFDLWPGEIIGIVGDPRHRPVAGWSWRGGICWISVRNNGSRCVAATLA
jgi:hypothetical protein